MKVIDGNNMILGRVASNVAKMLLNGEEVAIVNAEKMVMSGDLPYLVEKYRKRRTMKDKASPQHSPKWPRRPDLFVRRIVRGMLPWDNARGRRAYERLTTHVGVPKALEAADRTALPGASAEKLNTKYHSVELLCSRLGYGRG
jgi:large subunit ribosomal protein L13